MNATLSKAAIIFLSLAAGFVWLVAAFDYGDDVAAGNYSFSDGGVRSTLILNPNHRFHQVFSTSRQTQVADGTWRRLGEGGLVFSSEYITLPGQERSPDGDNYASMHKALGLFVSLECAQYNILWYSKARDQDATDTYRGDEDGYVQILNVKADSTFDQSVTHAGLTRTTTGQWKARTGGGLIFSKEFLNASGLPLEQDETAETADGTESNSGVLQIQVSKHESFGTPIWRKRYTP